MFNTPMHIRLPLEKLAVLPIYESFAPPLPQDIYEHLKTSIASVRAILCPLIVEFHTETNTYIVIDGHYRFRAAKELHFIDAPCIRIFTEDQRIEALMANANRRQLSPEQRIQLIRSSRLLRAKARQSLIPELAEIHKDGRLTRYIGHENVLYLMGVSFEAQKTFHNEISLTFSQPTPSTPVETQLFEELKRVRAALAMAKIREEELEQQLQQNSVESITLSTQLSGNNDETLPNSGNQQPADKSRMKQQLEALQTRYNALKDDKDKACTEVRVLKGQLKSAEAEMAAAQMHARDAERRLNTTTRQNANPQLITTSFDSLLKLATTIESLVLQASPLHLEEIKQFQQHVQLVRERLTDIDTALITPQADVVPINRHVKAKSAVPSAAQAN